VMRGRTELHRDMLRQNLFGHCLDHLSSDYHEALCRIGAQLFGFAKRGSL
jgi:hypothetical protein